MKECETAGTNSAGTSARCPIKAERIQERVDRVSVCIPAYAQPDMLRRCLTSISKQTLLPDEVIISDDTADQSVRDVVNDFEELLCIRYFHNVPPKGTPENWNHALTRAGGDVLLLMHHDDWLYNDRTLEELFLALKDTRCDMAYGKSLNVLQDKVLSVHDPGSDQVTKINRNPRTLFYYNLIGAPSAVMFRNNGVLFNPALKWLVDVDFYIRYLGRGRVCYTEKALIGIGLSPAQMTRQCFNNPEVETRENVLVYSALEKSLKYVLSDTMHFVRLFSRLRFSPDSVWMDELPFVARLGYYVSLPVYWYRRYCRKNEVRVTESVC